MDAKQLQRAEPAEKSVFLYVVLITALLLNLVFVVLLVYFETKPREPKKHSGDRCSPVPTGTDAKFIRTARSGAPLAQNAANNTKPSALAWGKYQVTHSYVMTVPYYSYNVLIYQQNKGAKPTSTDDLDKFFYQPALILNAPNIRISMNPFSQRYEILVPVALWNEAYENHIRQQIMDQTGKNNFLLSIIPLEEIRIKSVNPNTKVQFVTRWMAFASQPSVVNFRIICKDSESCAELLVQIKENPDQLVADLRVFYSLESQRSIGKRITVTAEHVQKSSLFAQINQKLANKDPVYLTSDDANTLQLEIMNNIQATEIEDEDFVSDSNQPTLMGLVNEALGLTSRNSKNFGAHVWDSVFWSEDNSRPDKITKQLNDFATMLDEESREKMKTEQSKAQKSGWEFEAKASYKKVSVGAGASQEQTSSEISESEREQLKKLLKESKGKSETHGLIFKPKPMEMKRINTGNIKSGMALSTAIVRVSRARAQITDIIKVTDIIEQTLPTVSILTFSKEPEVFHVRAQDDFILFTRNEAKEICRQYNARLATTRQVEEAWVIGADWCSAGHVEDDRIAYPGHICYTIAKDTSGNTIVPLKYVTASCEEESAVKKSFVYKSETKNAETNPYKDSWRFGANCWGLKPALRTALKYGGRTLRVWNFNATHYSQF